MWSYYSNRNVDQNLFDIIKLSPFILNSGDDKNGIVDMNDIFEEATNRLRNNLCVKMLANLLIWKKDKLAIETSNV